MKKIICLLLTIVMIVSLGIPAFAENNAVEEDNSSLNQTNLTENFVVLKKIVENGNVARLLKSNDCILWENDIITGILSKNGAKEETHVRSVAAYVPINIDELVLIKDLISNFAISPFSIIASYVPSTTSTPIVGATGVVNYSTMDKARTATFYCNTYYKVAKVQSGIPYYSITKVTGGFSTSNGTSGSNLGNNIKVKSAHVVIQQWDSSTSKQVKDVTLAASSRSWTTWAPTTWKPVANESTMFSTIGAIYIVTLIKGTTVWSVEVPAMASNVNSN